MYISNAFSLNMIKEVPEHGASIHIKPVDTKTAQRIARNESNESQSIVGHASTAAVFESVLECPVPANRVTVELVSGDMMLVGQYIGERLPEGATALPEGAEIKWFVVALVQ